MPDNGPQSQILDVEFADFYFILKKRKNRMQFKRWKGTLKLLLVKKQIKQYIFEMAALFKKCGRKSHWIPVSISLSWFYFIFKAKTKHNIEKTDFFPTPRKV